MTFRPRHLTIRSAELLTLSTEPWLSCDDCFDQMDGFVETLLGRGDHSHAPEHDVALRVHLAGCLACAEEVESLLELVAADDGVDAAPVIASLRASLPAATDTD